MSSAERSGRESINVQLSVFRSIGVSDRVCFLFKSQINFSIFLDSQQNILS